MKKFLVFLQLLLLIHIATAVDSDYNILVQENGNSLVLIELSGSGLVNMPLQDDVTDVRVKGALYTISNKSIDVSIGSAEKAILLYKTSFLTTKQNGVWRFKAQLVNTTKERVTVAIPKEVMILETTPPAAFEFLNYTKILWEGNLDVIELKYRFPKEDEHMIIDTETKNNANKIFIITSILFVVTASIMIILFRVKNKKSFRKSASDKENIIRTLSENEGLVIGILMRNNAGMRRSKLEKESKLAKSSLANTLNNLERKKIIEIDKTCTTHYIKFTRWFDEL